MKPYYLLILLLFLSGCSVESLYYYKVTFSDGSIDYCPQTMGGRVLYGMCLCNRYDNVVNSKITGENVTYNYAMKELNNCSGLRESISSNDKSAKGSMRK